MKPSLILLLAGCLYGIPASYAQELRPERSEPQQRDGLAYRAHETVRLYFGGTLPEWTDTQWLREEVDPIQRARRALRQRMDAESLRAAEGAAAAAAPRDPSFRAGRMQFLFGNGTSGNWSPYPDRALDARVIRFPMRRDAQADKRTDRQKALDKIRGRD